MKLELRPSTGFWECTPLARSSAPAHTVILDPTTPPAFRRHLDPDPGDGQTLRLCDRCYGLLVAIQADYELAEREHCAGHCPKCASDRAELSRLRGTEREILAHLDDLEDTGQGKHVAYRVGEVVGKLRSLRVLLADLGRERDEARDELAGARRLSRAWYRAARELLRDRESWRLDAENWVRRPDFVQLREKLEQAGAELERARRFASAWKGLARRKREWHRDAEHELDVTNAELAEARRDLDRARRELALARQAAEPELPPAPSLPDEPAASDAGPTKRCVCCETPLAEPELAPSEPERCANCADGAAELARPEVWHAHAGWQARVGALRGGTFSSEAEAWLWVELVRRTSAARCAPPPVWPYPPAEPPTPDEWRAWRRSGFGRPCAPLPARPSCGGGGAASGVRSWRVYLDQLLFRTPFGVHPFRCSSEQGSGPGRVCSSAANQTSATSVPGSTGATGEAMTENTKQDKGLGAFGDRVARVGLIPPTGHASENQGAPARLTEQLGEKGAKAASDAEPVRPPAGSPAAGFSREQRLALAMAVEHARSALDWLDRAGLPRLTPADGARDERDRATHHLEQAADELADYRRRAYRPSGCEGGAWGSVRSCQVHGGALIDEATGLCSEATKAAQGKKGGDHG